MLLTRVNGRQRDYIPVSSRGLAYGDGVFTTLKIVRRQPQLWQAHQRRLARDCERLALSFDAEALRQEVTELCAAADEGTADLAALKIILTRVEGARGYRPQSTESVRILQLVPLLDHPSRAHLEQGVAVTVCRQRLTATLTLAGVKHLNRLEQVLARAEWDEEYQEGLMLDSNDHVIEGTMSNVFAVSGDKLLTPLLNRCGVAGVMREHLMMQAPALGLTVKETLLTIDHLYQADGVFICNALIGALPLARINGHDCRAAAFIAGIFRQLSHLASEA